MIPFTHSIPNAIAPLKDKSKLKSVISLSMLTSLVFYWLVGALSAYFFNESTLPLVVLNWGNYSGRNGGWGEGTPNAIAFVVKFIIMLFPVCIISKGVMRII